MQVYQIDTSISNNGMINLSLMPHLYSKKVKLVIIPAEDSREDSAQRKHAMARLLKEQETMPASHWTDEELDNFRHEHLTAKHVV
jgi:hypothetical protein